MKLSQRIIKTKPSPIRKFIPLADKALKEGVRVYFLNIGQPDLKTPPAIWHQIKKFKSDPIAYAPSPGFLAVRQAWSDYFKSYKIDFKPEEILITEGASEALSFIFIALCDPGDEVMVFEPFYANYKSYTSAVNVKLVPVISQVEENFTLPDEQAIIKQINKRTKAILICTPNNPTGSVYQKEEIARLVKIAKKYKLWLISDETYREMVFNQKDIVSLAWWPQIRNQLVIIDSASKKFSFCGGRVGCLASKNKQLIENTLKLAQTRLAAATIDQLIVVPLLKDSKKYTIKIIKEYRKRARTVYRVLSKIPGVVCFPSAGALYLIAKLPVDDAEKFVKFMLKKFRYKNQTVIVTPARDFYLTPGKGKKEIRISYVLAVPQLKKAMEVLKKGLAVYNKK